MINQKILIRTALAIAFGLVFWIGLLGGKIVLTVVLRDPSFPGFTLLAIVVAAAVWLFDWYTDKP